MSNIHHFVIRGDTVGDEYMPADNSEWYQVWSQRNMQKACEEAQKRHHSMLAWRNKEHGYMLFNTKVQDRNIVPCKGYRDGGIPSDAAEVVYAGPTYKDGTFSAPRNMRVLHKGVWYDCHPCADESCEEWVWPIRYECHRNEPNIFPHPGVEELLKQKETT